MAKASVMITRASQMLGGERVCDFMKLCSLYSIGAAGGLVFLHDLSSGYLSINEVSAFCVFAALIGFMIKQLQQVNQVYNSKQYSSDQLSSGA